QHDRASGGERGGKLPALEHERGVPRSDESCDTDWLSVHVVHLNARDLVGVVALGDHEVCEKPEVLGGTVRLAKRLSDRQTRVEGFELCELIAACLYLVGNAVQDAAALTVLHTGPRPGIERALCRSDREVNVC